MSNCLSSGLHPKPSDVLDDQMGPEA